MEWKEIATPICISFFKKDVFNIVIGSLLPASLFFVFLYNFLSFPILVFVLFCLMLNHSKLIDIPKFCPILFWLKHTHETFETSLYRFQAVRYASTFNPKRVLFLDLYFQTLQPLIRGPVYHVSCSSCSRTNILFFLKYPIFLTYINFFLSGPRVNLAKLSQSTSNQHRNAGNLELVMTEDTDHHPIRTQINKYVFYNFKMKHIQKDCL